MPEILTESFCERCGTRYTFESAAPRATRLKGVKVLSRGLKNFVMSDDTSLDEAMAAARNDTDRELTAQQLDAFHKTFNFCMQCRQYTCANCWNEAEGRCLTCAPHLGQGVLEAPFPDLDVATGLDLRLEPNGNGSNGSNGHHNEPAPLAWPTSDLLQGVTLDEPNTAPVADATADPLGSIDAIARLAALDVGTDATSPPPGAGSAPTAEATDLADLADDAPASETASPTPTADSTPAPRAEDTIDARAAAAAAATARLLQAFRPGQSLDAALEAYEREQAAERSLDGTGPFAAPEVERTPEAGTAPEISEAVAASDADTAAPDAESAPAPEAAAVPEAAAAPPEPARPVDRVEQPTWRIVAPDHGPAIDGPTTDAPAVAPIAASAEPQWPAQPQWPSHTPSAGLPFLGRPAAPTGGIDALWAESAREVSAVPTTGPVAAPSFGTAKPAGGVQPCVSCGLSLSATARFCRRCGSRQG